MGDSIKLMMSGIAWLFNSGWFLAFEDTVNGLISLVSLLIILVANLDKLKTQIEKLINFSNNKKSDDSTGT